MFLAPLAGAIGTGAAGLGAASTLSLIGTGVSTVTNFAQAQYQGAIAQRQAALLDEQADHVSQRGQIDQQETDFAALQQMGVEQGRMAASGFSTNSTSFTRRSAITKILARRDALRVREDAERESLSLRNAAEAKRAEAAAAKRSALFSLFEGAMGMGSDLIGSATLVNRRKIAELGLQTNQATLG
jgi:hypothetical protein